MNEFMNQSINRTTNQWIDPQLDSETSSVFLNECGLLTRNRDSFSRFVQKVRSGSLKKNDWRNVSRLAASAKRNPINQSINRSLRLPTTLHNQSIDGTSCLPDLMQIANSSRARWYPGLFQNQRVPQYIQVRKSNRKERHFTLRRL